MARYRGQKALYEVMHKTRNKPSDLVEPVQVQPSDIQPKADLQVAEDPAQEQTVPSPVVRWRRPRWIQFNAGRVELTIPYPIAIAFVLALILIVVAAYRLGQRSGIPGS
jgi:hypothetical protein